MAHVYGSIIKYIKYFLTTMRVNKSYLHALPNKTIMHIENHSLQIQRMLYDRLVFCNDR